MSKYRNQILLVCPAALREKANAAMVAMLGPGHEETFSSGYSTDGKTVTHYVASGALTDGHLGEIKKFVESVPEIEIVVDGAAKSLASMGDKVQVTRKKFVAQDVIRNKKRWLPVAVASEAPARGE